MARNRTRDELTQQILSECRLSTNQSRGIDHRNYVIQLINRYYQDLWSDHDWPFAQIHREDAGKNVNAGQRYYDFPATLDVERAYNIWYKLGSAWTLLEYGIDTSNYSAFDSDAGETTDPPLRWEIRDGNQFEIWPMPASNLVGGLRFEGYRKKTELIASDDRCDLDDSLIVLFVAAEILAGNKAADAPVKLSAAQARLVMLRGREPRPRVIMGGGGDTRQNYRIIGGRFAKIYS